MNKNLVWTYMVLFAPAVITFFVLWLFRDAILTQVFLMATFFVLPKLFNKYSRRFYWTEDQEFLGFFRDVKGNPKELLMPGKIFFRFLRLFWLFSLFSVFLALSRAFAQFSLY